MNGLNELFMVLSVIVGSLLLVVVVAVKPLRKIAMFLFHSLIGGVMLSILNFITVNFGFTVGVNFVTMALFGFFGFYGLPVTYLLNYCFK